ncbi:helix-turn-helix domain-containing protein [Actinomadura madurae]|uniref:helix-turn-helix domain-containing protein n=1 Tax=Actinomadura madurae TaxID=1993 RepID=UPI0027E39BF1|nr:helix-turn-helix transcriptional regulator [Actinomadura madurae]
MIDQALAARALTAPENPLTDRELDVLRLAASGSDPSEIAARLHLSRGTVRNYLGAIVTKLNARNRLDAIRIATEADWL